MNEQSKAQSAVPYFSIVIPAYNEEEHIGACLESIFNSDYESTKYEVVVVDNGSQDSSYDIAANLGRARVFQLLEGNVGAVRNYGAAQARGQIIIFIDADCLLDTDWLNRAEKLIREHPDGAYGGGVKLPNNATWIEKSWLLQKDEQPILPKHLIGASIVLPKDLFFELEGFDELVSSGEDTDFHHRLTSAKVSVLIDHSLDITHLGNAKTAIHFIKRQIWHSENYAANISRSFKDPIFLVTLLFIILPILAVIQKLSSSNSRMSIFIILIWALVPALLSFKRLYRAKHFVFNPKKMLEIYYLDLIYLSGRSLGLLKGILKLIL